MCKLDQHGIIHEIYIETKGTVAFIGINLDIA